MEQNHLSIKLRRIYIALLEPWKPCGDRYSYETLERLSLVGMRNRLIHAYFEIDLDIVWQVVTNDLPLILIQVNRAISDLENPN